MYSPQHHFPDIPDLLFLPSVPDASEVHLSGYPYPVHKQEGTISKPVKICNQACNDGSGRRALFHLSAQKKAPLFHSPGMRRLPTHTYRRNFWPSFFETLLALRLQGCSGFHGHVLWRTYLQSSSILNDGALGPPCFVAFRQPFHWRLSHLFANCAAHVRKREIVPHIPMFVSNRVLLGC